MTTVQANDPRTPSAQIADQLRAQIERGDLQPGARLPSGRALARQYGVALMTAQNAVQRLRDEKRVYPTGRGYFVGEGPTAHGVEDSALAQRLEEVATEVRELRARVESLESKG